MLLVKEVHTLSLPMGVELLVYVDDVISSTVEDHASCCLVSAPAPFCQISPMQTFPIWKQTRPMEDIDNQN